MRKYRKHSLEFKCRVITEVKENNVGVTELARRYRVSPSLIRIWIQKFESGEYETYSKTLREVRLENRIAMLERKIGQLTVENDSLRNRFSGDTAKSGTGDGVQNGGLGKAAMRPR